MMPFLPGNVRPTLGQLALLLGLVGVVLLAYSDLLLLGNDAWRWSTWDDDNNWTGNARVALKGGYSWANGAEVRAACTWFFRHGVLIGVYEPLANVLRLLQAGTLGLATGPRPVLLVTLTLHVLNAVLVATLPALITTKRLFGAPRVASSGAPTVPVVTRASLVVAALCALHPLHSQVVCWASCQGYPLAACFCLLSLAFMLRAEGASVVVGGRGGSSRAGAAAAWQMLSVLSYAAAVLCKSAAVPFVAVSLLLRGALSEDRGGGMSMLSRGLARAFGSPGWCLHTAGLVAVAALGARVALLANAADANSALAKELALPPPPAFPALGLGLAARLGSSLGWYTAQAAMPTLVGGLHAAFYPFPRAAVLGGGVLEVLFAVAGLALAGLLACAAVLRGGGGGGALPWWQLCGVCIAVAVSMLSPTLGLAGVQHGWPTLAADRYAYLPLHLVAATLALLLQQPQQQGVGAVKAAGKAAGKVGKGKRGAAAVKTKDTSTSPSPSSGGTSNGAPTLALVLGVCAALLTLTRAGVGVQRDVGSYWNYTVGLESSLCPSLLRELSTHPDGGSEDGDALRLVRRKVCALGYYNSAAELSERGSYATGERLSEADTAAAAGVRCLRAAVTLNPKYAEAHGNLGNALLRATATRETHAEAMLHLRRRAELQPSSASGAYNVAVGLLEYKGDGSQRSGAEEAFRHVIALAAGEVAALRAGGDKATTGAGEAAAAAAKTTSSNAWNNVGLLLHEQFDGTGATGQKLHGAVAAFQKASAMAPDDPAPLANLASAFSAGGAHAEAADAQGKAVALSDRSKEASSKEASSKNSKDEFDMVYRLGVLRKTAQQLPGAEAAYTRAVALRPASADALHNLGDVQLSQGGAAKRGEAVASFLAAIAAEPRHFHAHNSLGNAYFAALNEEAGAAPAGGSGISTDTTGNAAAAEGAYRRALAARPDNPAALQNLGMAMLRQGKARYAEAAVQYAAVVRLQPENKQAAATLSALTKM